MAELEKIKSVQKMFRAFGSLDRATNLSLEMAHKSISAIVGTGD
jgi:ABC-type branched-subunit amino acid transport system ATPase component